MEVMDTSKTALKFRAAESWLGPLDSQVAAMLVAAAGDIVLSLDQDGIIREIASGSADLPNDGCQAWIGRKWSAASVL